ITGAIPGDSGICLSCAPIDWMRTKQSASPNNPPRLLRVCASCPVRSQKIAGHFMFFTALDSAMLTSREAFTGEKLKIQRISLRQSREAQMRLKEIFGKTARQLPDRCTVKR